MKGEKKEKKKYKQEGEETEENEREIKTSISKKMTTLKKQVNFAWEPTLVKTELVSTREYDEDYIQMYPLCKGTQVQSWRYCKNDASVAACTKPGRPRLLH